MTEFALGSVAIQGRLRLEFADFFQAEYGRLARALFLLSGDASEADDLAQEALVRLYERWDRVESMESPTAYLYRTALNLNRSRLRQVAMRARRALSFQTSHIEDPLAAVEDRDQLSRLLAALPRAQREAVVLQEWLGLDAEQAGKILGISPGAARMRLSRARSFLRERQGRDGDG